MKTGKSLSELAEEIERQRESKVDYRADTRHIELETDHNDAIMVNVQGVHGVRSMKSLAHRQIGTHVGIPARYYDRCRELAPDLLCDQVNHWFKHEPATRMVRELDGNVRAFLSDRYKRIDNIDVAGAMLPALREIPGIEVVSSEITDSRMYIKVVDPTIRGEVKLNDVCDAGVIISNSEVGLGSMSIEPFVRRLVCLNGMKVGDKRFRRTHVGGKVAEEEGRIAAMLSDETMQAGDHAMMLQARDVLRAALDQAFFDETMRRLRGAANDRITGDVIKGVEILEDRLTLSKEESAAVLRNIIEGGDLSRWGMANAVTAIANDDAVDYDRATELEALGGKVIDLTETEWEPIARAA